MEHTEDSPLEESKASFTAKEDSRTQSDKDQALPNFAEESKITT